MNVNLTPELEALIQRKVESGLYNNQSEVVREALRLYAAHDRMQEAQLSRLRSSLDEGTAQADRGELLDGPEAIKDLRKSIQHRRRSGTRGK